MLQFTKSQLVKKSRFYIPYQMRAALAFHSGSDVYLSLPEDSADRTVNQLVVSPIPHSQQSDLWTAKIVFQDRPGIIADLTGLLRGANLDIVDFRSATRNQQQELVVHATFDAEFYESSFDGDTAARRKNPRLWPKELYARILASFIDDLKFRADGKPNVFIVRNYVLRDSLNGNIERHTVSIDEGLIEVPRSVMFKIKASFQKDYDLSYKKSGRSAQMLCSLCIDSGFRVLLATFYYRNTGHVHLRIRAKNEVGAIARLTGAVSKAGFNILQANSRDINANTALNDLLLRLPPDRDQLRDDKKLRAYAKGVLTDATLRDLTPRVVFPKLIAKQEIEDDQRKI